MKTPVFNAAAPTAADHAGVDPRNGYRPPRALVSRLARDTASGWSRIPPVPAMTDPSGETLTDRARVRLAYDGERFYVDARIREAAPVVRPDRAPGHSRFWEQDHMEIRFLRDGQHDLDQVQFIVSADGRAWDNQGLWKSDGIVRCSGRRFRGGWSVRLSVPFAALKMAPPSEGDTWRGLVAHTRWGGGGPDMACSAAVELGFQQAERFGEWRFAGAPGAAFPEPPRRFPPPRPFPLFRWQAVEGLGAISWRAPLPPLKEARRVRRHPGLLFDERELDAIRARMEREPFRSERTRFHVEPADLTGAGLPGPDEPVSMAITAGCMNWFRVAKETMLRDGEGGRKPAAAYLWQRQSGEAREAWRGIVRTVKPSPADLEILCRELNGLLARPDFYDASAFAEVHLPAEGRELLARGIPALRPDEVFRLNRIILQSSVECIGAFRMDLVMKPGGLWSQWLATGDARLIATATRAVRAALRLTIMDHQIHLHEGMAAGSVALAYDSFYPHLGAEDRAVWRQLLMRFIRLYLETARRRSWTVTTIANANPVGNGGCGLAALALLDECPAEAREALDHARRNIRLWLEYCGGTDGGNTEGAQYWQYGMENFLRFARALERVTGSGDGLLDHPAVANAMNMIRVGLCNDGALHGVNDTIPMPMGGPIAWFLAGRTGDRFALWYGDHALAWLRAREAAGRPVAYNISLADMLLNRPAGPVVKKQPPLPEAIMLRDIHYGMLRSGKAFDCRWTAGLKGSRPPYTHHNQRDTGAVFLDLRGERLLIDPGYYKPEPGDHALPLIGGRGPVQPTGWTGAITGCGKRGALRWLTVDSTAAYAGAAVRVVRHLVMVGEAGVVLLDDIVADSPVTAQYTCGGITKLRGPCSVNIIGTKARLRMDLLNRPAARVELLPERSLHDSHWGYHFADCRLFPVTAAYDPDPVQPLVTVFLDATEGNPGRCRLEKQAGRLTVRLPSGEAVSFKFFEGGWRLAERHAI